MYILQGGKRATPFSEMKLFLQGEKLIINLQNILFCSTIELGWYRKSFYKCHSNRIPTLPTKVSWFELDCL